MSLLDWFRGPPKTLENVTEPTKVDVSGQIVSDDAATSPATGKRANVFCWRLFFGHEKREYHRELARHIQGAGFVVECPGGRLWVRNANLYVTWRLFDEHPWPETLPASFHEAIRRAGSYADRMRFHELPLAKGRRVNVRGWVQPVDERVTDYRSARRRDYEFETCARPDDVVVTPDGRGSRSFLELAGEEHERRKASGWRGRRRD